MLIIYEYTDISTFFAELQNVFGCFAQKKNILFNKNYHFSELKKEPTGR